MKFSKKAFKAYLESNPRKLFKVESECRCPIAAYVCTLTPNPVRVDGYTISILDEQEADVIKQIALPKWAYSFVDRFDSLRFKGRISVCGKTALKVLENLEV
jgi:hypothetical protein